MIHVFLSTDPFSLPWQEGELTFAWLLVIVFAGVYLSEELTLVGVGLLITRGAVDYPTALAVCWLVLWVGDMLSWGIGRALGTVASKRQPRWLSRIVPVQQRQRFAELYRRHGVWLILAARAIPAARIPAYLCAGAVGDRPARFVLCVLVTTGVWSASLLGLAVWLGESLGGLLSQWGFFGAAAVLVVVLLLLVYRMIRRCRFQNEMGDSPSPDGVSPSASPGDRQTCHIEPLEGTSW